jgi:hypothetical protein
MAPERIELTSGLGVEGLAPVATAQAVHGQGTAGTGEKKEPGQGHRRPDPPADEVPVETVELSGDSMADQDHPEQECERQIDPEQKQDRHVDFAPHRGSHHIDSLA